MAAPVTALVCNCANQKGFKSAKAIYAAAWVDVAVAVTAITLGVLCMMGHLDLGLSAQRALIGGGVGLLLLDLTVQSMCGLRRAVPKKARAHKGGAVPARTTNPYAPPLEAGQTTA